MQSTSKNITLGRLTEKPELKHWPDGSAYCNFSVAVNVYWKDKQSGEKKTRADFPRFRARGFQAEKICEWGNKGDAIYVEGVFREDKKGDVYYQYHQVTNFSYVGASSDGPAKPTDSGGESGFDF